MTAFLALSSSAPSTFFTADTHFGHANVIEYSHRPFRDKEHMDEELIARWNAKVPPNAIVYHMGDFGFYTPKALLPILNSLHGTIRLIKGNHDKAVKGELAKRFDWVKDYYEAKAPDERKLVLSHYPMMTWNKSHYGSWMLHGHCHGSLKAPPTTRLDVGVDCQGNYEPWSWEEIEAVLSTRSYHSEDHHNPENPR